jgi:hypothetical protein
MIEYLWSIFNIFLKPGNHAQADAFLAETSMPKPLCLSKVPRATGGFRMDG